MNSTGTKPIEVQSAPFSIQGLNILMLNQPLTSQCELYEMQVSANLGTNTSNITRETHVFISINTAQLQLNQMLAKLATTYHRLFQVNDPFSSTQKTLFSVDLLDLVRLNSPQQLINFHVTLLDTTDSIEYTVNNQNGLLVIKLNKELQQFTERFRFRVSLLDSREGEFLAHFTLNLYLHNKFSTDLNRRSVFFTKAFYEFTLNLFSNAPSIHIKDMLYNPFNVTNFSLRSNSQYHIDANSNLVLASGAKSSGTGVQQVMLHVCNEHLTCDSTSLIIKLTAAKQGAINSERIESSTPIMTSTFRIREPTQPPTTATTTTTTTTETILVKVVTADVKVVGHSDWNANLIVFIVLLCLIVLLSIVTLVTLFCLSQVSCCQSGDEETASHKYNSRKTLELSMNSDNNNNNNNDNVNGSMTSSDGSFSCRGHAHNSNRQRVSVSNLLATQLQESYLSPCGEVFGKGFLSEFEMLRFTLNWEPSYDQFKTVIGEFEQFPRSLPNSGQPGMGAVYHDADTNPYDQYADGQTFV